MHRDDLIFLMATGFAAGRLDVTGHLEAPDSEELLEDEISDALHRKLKFFQKVVDRMRDMLGSASRLDGARLTDSQGTTMVLQKRRRAAPRDPKENTATVARLSMELMLESAGIGQVKEGSPGWEDAPLRFIFPLDPPTTRLTLFEVFKSTGNKIAFDLLDYDPWYDAARLIEDLLTVSANEILTVDMIGPVRLGQVLDTLREMHEGGSGAWAT